jgi:hypothetical protein
MRLDWMKKLAGGTPQTESVVTRPTAAPSESPNPEGAEPVAPKLSARVISMMRSPFEDPFDPETIYFVESAADPTALLARGTSIRDGMLTWDDTNRDRIVELKAIEIDGDAIRVQTHPENRSYRFVPLTLEIYEERVRPYVELSPGFESTKALTDFYRAL